MLNEARSHRQKLRKSEDERGSCKPAHAIMLTEKSCTIVTHTFQEAIPYLRLCNMNYLKFNVSAQTNIHIKLFKTLLPRTSVFFSENSAAQTSSLP